LTGAGAAMALATLALIAPDGAAPVGGGAAAAVQDAVTAAAPAVMHRNITKVEPRERKDRRSVRAGLTVEGGYAFIWGLGDHGASGGPNSSIKESEYLNYSPALVEGLPQGSIVDMAAGSYDYNVIDTEGCVWGWGRWGTRNGTGRQVDISTHHSTPPQKVRIGGRYDEGGKELCGIRELSMTDVAGAGISEDGAIWSWGENKGGGPHPPDVVPEKNDYPGAQLVQDLPSIDDDPTNRPVQIEGGFSTFWVLLANGDVWYFGGGSDGFLEDWERPLGDQPTTNSGIAPGTKDRDDQPRPNMRLTRKEAKRNPVRAARSVALEPYFRRNNAEEYIVQVHSGIGFGAALLSTGRVLTWGQDEDDWAALGRKCEQKKSADRLLCARTPGYVDFGLGYDASGAPISPKVVGLSCGYTATVVLTEDGDLWAWSMPAISYEGHEILRDVDNTPVKMATQVADFQPGEGYIIWWTMDGRTRGIGYNQKGALGQHAGNYGKSGREDETAERPIWFAKERYMWCTYWDDQAWDKILEIDYDGDRSNGVQPPPLWKLDKTPSPNVYYIDANNNGKREPDEQITFIAGLVTEFTSGEVILFKTWDKWPCEELNNPANRLSYDYCISETIRLHKEFGTNPDGTFRKACS
jgi:hypothetical protein